MKTSDYKQLMVWKKAIELSKEIYIIVKKLPKEETYALSDQLRRAVISIPTNIAEGHGRISHKEFLNFLSIARGSVCEVESLCIVAVEIGLFNSDDILKSVNLCNEISRMIKSLAAYISQDKPSNN